MNRRKPVPNLCAFDQENGLAKSGGEEGTGGEQITHTLPQVTGVVGVFLVEMTSFRGD